MLSQLQAASFDLGDIEDVVDQPNQAFRIGQRRPLQQFAIAGIFNPAIDEELQGSFDRRQRRAQFVADD